jgi:prephenate dehydrogenase
MRVGIVGLGLIGGSIGLAAAERGDEVVAFDPDADARAAGVECGAAARVEETLEAAVADVEVAVVCGPVVHRPATAAP